MLFGDFRIQSVKSLCSAHNDLLSNHFLITFDFAFADYNPQHRSILSRYISHCHIYYILSLSHRVGIERVAPRSVTQNSALQL